MGGINAPSTTGPVHDKQSPTLLKELAVELPGHSQ